MSSGVVTVTIHSASSGTRVCGSLFVNVTMANRDFVTSTTRRSSKVTLEEKFDAEYDSSHHPTTVVVDICDKKERLARFLIEDFMRSGQTSHSDPSTGATVSLTCSYAPDYGSHDPSARSPLFFLSYASVLALWLLPQHFEVPYWLNLVLTSTR